MSPRLPMPQRPKSQARQIAELERHRRQEERRLDDSTSGRTSSSSVTGVTPGFTVNSYKVDEFTSVLASGIWLVDARAYAEWSGAIGTLEAEITDATNASISGLHRTFDTVDMHLYIPSYRYISNGTSDDRLKVEAATIGGSSATIDWQVTAVFLAATS